MLASMLQRSHEKEFGAKSGGGPPFEGAAPRPSQAKGLVRRSRITGAGGGPGPWTTATGDRLPRGGRRAGRVVDGDRGVLSPVSAVPGPRREESSARSLGARPGGAETASRRCWSGSPALGPRPTSRPRSWGGFVFLSEAKTTTGKAQVGVPCCRPRRSRIGLCRVLGLS
jgi:hypothetical protein